MLESTPQTKKKVRLATRTEDGQSNHKNSRKEKISIDSESLDHHRLSEDDDDEPNEDDQENENYEDDETDSVDDEAHVIEFISRISRGQDATSAASGLQGIRKSDLLSALHWTGRELSERARLGKIVSALEKAECTIRSQIDTLLSNHEDLLYLKNEDIRNVILHNQPNFTQIITICMKARSELTVLETHFKLHTSAGELVKL